MKQTKLCSKSHKTVPIMWVYYNENVEVALRRSDAMVWKVEDEYRFDGEWTWAYMMYEAAIENEDINDWEAIGAIYSPKKNELVQLIDEKVISEDRDKDLKRMTVKIDSHVEMLRVEEAALNLDV